MTSTMMLEDATLAGISSAMPLGSTFRTLSLAISLSVNRLENFNVSVCKNS
jgi:hypothetical protein